MTQASATKPMLDPVQPAQDEAANVSDRRRLLACVVHFFCDVCAFSSLPCRKLLSVPQMSDSDESYTADSDDEYTDETDDNGE